MKVKNYSIGTDIEMFFQDKKSGEIVSAEGFVPGTKHEPFVFDPNNKYFSTSLDNVLAEFTVPPAQTKHDWLSSILKSMDYVQSLAEKANCVAVALPAAYLDKKYLRTKNAREFGCDADFNVWLKSQNPKPVPTKGLRSGGLHVHVGYEDSNLDVNEAVIKTLDLFLGVPSILMEPDNDRKKLYGKAGTFRFKPYGVEYRTLSNHFISSRRLIEWVYEGTENAIDFVNNNDLDFLDTYADKIMGAINNNDKVAAQNLINEFNLVTA
ncbi:hypothetical protein [Leptolyngbya phage Lbo-JY46]